MTQLLFHWEFPSPYFLLVCYLCVVTCVFVGLYVPQVCMPSLFLSFLLLFMCCDLCLCEFLCATSVYAFFVS